MENSNNTLQECMYEKIKTEVLRLIYSKISFSLLKVNDKTLSRCEEIRIRTNRPVMLVFSNSDCFIDKNGLTTKKIDNCLYADSDSIMKTLEHMSNNSIYVYQNDICNGFLTLTGGHRVGVTGKTILENGNVKYIKDISGINIRIAREIIGCSENIIKYIVKDNHVFNTLIISPPQAGKTTIIRDIAWHLSNGNNNIRGFKIGIIDERSEIAACLKGVPQFNVGIRTDVVDACPKLYGLQMVIRSMSPDIVITDEIGNYGDFEAIMKVINSGVKIITTAHGYNISELKAREDVLKLLSNKIFERVIVLSCVNGPGTIEEIVDGNSMQIIYRRGKSDSENYRELNSCIRLQHGRLFCS